MKRILLAFLALSLISPTVHAKEISSYPVQSLVSRLKDKQKARKVKIQSGFIKFFMSPTEPKQGEAVTIFAQNLTGFEGNNVILEATFNGIAVTLDHPAKELWIYDAGTFSEVGVTHEFKAKIFVENADDARQIREAIQALNAEIADINLQISQEADPIRKAELIALRNEKIGQRTELFTILENLKSEIAEESTRFSVSSSAGEGGFPSISLLVPNSGRTGNLVTVTGQNFSEDMVVKLGGITVASNFISSTEFTFNVPEFSGNFGVKDLEVKIAGDIVKNAILKNAFFLVSGGGGANTPPVAYAGAAKTIGLGATTTMDGSFSYDSEGDAFSYEWKFVSVPDGSSISTGTVYNTNSQFEIQPDVEGFYVAELTVAEMATTDLYHSLPSLTTIYVLGNLPPSIPEISGHTLWSESSGNGIPVTVTFETMDEVTDPDGEIVECKWQFPGSIIRYGSVSDGYCHITHDFYAAGEYSVTLTAKDDMGATTSVTDTIEVFTDPNSDGRFTVSPVSGSAPLAITFDASLASNPSSMFDRYRWRYGGGGQDNAVIGYHTFENAGEYNVRFDLSNRNAAGNSGIWTRLQTRVYVDESAPVYGAAPIVNLRPTSPREQVINTPFTFDASSSFDPDVGGSIASYSWVDAAGDWNVGTSTFSVTPDTARNNYACVLVADQAGGEADNCLEFLAVTQGKMPRAQVVADSLEGEAPFTVNFNTSGSFDADGTIVERVFRAGEEESEDTSVGVNFSHTYTTPGVYPYRFSVTDNDGNTYDWYEAVVVNEPGVKFKKRPNALDRDDNREQERLKRIYVTNCARGDGKSCYAASKIYEKEGNATAAQAYRAKACSLGVEEACSSFTSFLNPIQKILSRIKK